MVMRRSRDRRDERAAGGMCAAPEIAAMDHGGAGDGVGGLSEPHYRVSTLRHLPQMDVVVFPCFTENPTVSSILRIEPDVGAAWYAEVLSAAHGDGRFWATRDPYRCCALFASSVYWLDVRDPGSVVGYRTQYLSWETVVFVPSRDVLLLCGDPIVAYGPEGHRWTTGRLAFDGIEEVVLDGDVLRGIADTYPDGSVPFTVNLVTGEHTGGFPGWDALGARRLE